MWRLFIGLGAVPAAVALYFRLTIPETPRFTMDVKRNLDKAAADISAVFPGKGTKAHGGKNIFAERINIPKGSRRDFISYFRKRQNFKVLFGTAYCWFALDVCIHNKYFNSLNNYCLMFCADRFLWPWTKRQYNPSRCWFFSHADRNLWCLAPSLCYKPDFIGGSYPRLLGHLLVYRHLGTQANSIVGLRRADSPLSRIW